MHRMEKEFAGRTLVLETGRMAKLAQGSCLVQFGETVVLCTATVQNKPTHLPFFPLTVEYREKSYAAGKIPGGFFKREGSTRRKRDPRRPLDRPPDPAALPGRLQVRDAGRVLHPFRADQENDADVLALLGASVALNMSKVPFNGRRWLRCASGRIQGNLGA